MLKKIVAFSKNGHRKHANPPIKRGWTKGGKKGAIYPSFQTNQYQFVMFCANFETAEIVQSGYFCTSK
jgi:hypothetical protein